MSTISPSLKIGLQFLGAWPDMPYANVNRLVYMSSVLIMQYFQYLYVFAHCKSGELQKLVDGLPAAFDYSLMVTKLLALWTNHRMIREMLADMDSDWRECVSVEQDLRVMTTKANLSHYCTNIMLSFFMPIGVLYFVATYAMGLVDLAESDNNTSRPFPMMILFPSVLAEQTPIYELLVVFILVHVASITYTIAILDALIFSLVLHASGQIDIICRKLTTIFEKVSYCKSSGHTMGMLIEKHNKVITFSKKMDKLFSFMALMQLFWNTLVICSLGLIVMSSVHNDTIGMLKAAFAYGGIMMEILIFCFAGEYLGLKSRSLAAAAYNSLWYNIPNESKNMLFILMRSQKQMGITAGGMANLSLEVFANIMKTSASYISVLHAMY